MSPKRWIVNAAERTVRAVKSADTLDAYINDALKPGEFYWTGTYADAMEAGARRRMADEALGRLYGNNDGLVTVGDRIEVGDATRFDFIPAAERFPKLIEGLRALRYDMWREGMGLVVLGRL